MTAQQAVMMIDGAARVLPFGEGFWVKGAGWETKVTWSEQRAWELAVEQIAAHTFDTCSVCRRPVVDSKWHNHPCE